MSKTQGSVKRSFRGRRLPVGSGRRRIFSRSRFLLMSEAPESSSAADTIRAAAEAYISGDVDALSGYLHEGARLLGSEQRDQWGGREEIVSGLEPELSRRRLMPDSVSGSLVDQIRECSDVNEIGDVALWSTTGDLDIDGYFHNKASWTVVLNRQAKDSKGDWKIVHSHFSIHR